MELRALLAAGPCPAATSTQNIADLRAQIARLPERHRRAHRDAARTTALDVVQAYMQHVQDNAEAAVRKAIGVLRDGAFTYEMDNGAVLKRERSASTTRARSATIDFTGTSAQRPNNFNAPLPVTRAAVLYVFRTLVDDDIPMNAGCLKPLSLIVPEGSMLDSALSRPPWSRATWRRRRWSPTRCTARSACSPPRRAR